MKEKKYLIYGIVLVLLTAVGVTLAYFSNIIIGDKKKLSVTVADMKIVFNNGNGEFNGQNIEPGSYDEVQTFSVENATNSDYQYNIILKDYKNTFVTNGYLVYKITSTDGYNMTEFKDLPKSSTTSNVVIAYSVNLPAKTTHNYTIEIKYLADEDADQSDDMEKEVSGQIYISEGTEGPKSLAQTILRDNPTVSERTDFSVTYTENTTGTIFKTNKTEDGSDVYYYAGNTTNNWVKFGKYTTNGNFIGSDSLSETAKVNEFNTLEECNNSRQNRYNCHNLYETGDDMYWRIIRTNEDGSVRLLYAGTSLDTEEGYIGVSTYDSVGYMSGTYASLENLRQNTFDSTVKEKIDKWYEDNLLSNYDKYISKEAIYCSDRSIGSGTYSNSSSASFHYGPYTRLVTNNAPSYKCGANTTDGLFETTQAIEDKFSASTSGGGNGQLKYGVALISFDELVFAGGKYGESLIGPYAWYYLNNLGGSIIGGNYWSTMSPSTSDFGYKLLIYVLGYEGKGKITRLTDNFENVIVRPVLSLSSCVKVSGTGTPTDPYVVDENNSTCN